MTNQTNQILSLLGSFSKDNAQLPAINFNLTADQIIPMLQAMEERGYQRGYERAKQEEEAPLNTKEAAALLGVSESTIQNRIKDGKIKVHKFGAKNIFYKHEIKP